MAMFEGKKGLILGVANDRSLAWAIAQAVMAEGGECGFTYLPDSPYDEKKKNLNRVAHCLKGHDRAKFLLPLDVQNDRQIEEVMHVVHRQFGKIDFLLHSIAYADRRDLQRDTVRTSRDGFKLAMDISVYSLIAVANAVRKIMTDCSSILTLTYFGGEKCIPGYNVMGICKAALEAAVRYLAFDLGPHGTRVNALSAGPLKTLASAAVGAGELLNLYERIAPLGRNITHEEVGRTGAFLLSPLANGMTGEVVHLDAGYNIMGSPGRLLDDLQVKGR